MDLQREIYSDDDDVIYQFKRCIGINGINIAATKPDLLDRSILTELERIDVMARLGEDEVKSKFAALKPQLLGYIFDVLVRVLQVKNSGGIKLEELPRMANFAEHDEIISRCMGYKENEFLSSYFKNIDLITEEAINANPIATCIVGLMDSNTELVKKEINGDRVLEIRMSDLHQKLCIIASALFINTNDKPWPKSPTALARRINEVKTNLSERGVIIEPIILADRNRGIRITKRVVSIIKKEGKDNNCKNNSSNNNSLDPKQSLLIPKPQILEQNKKFIGIRNNSGNIYMSGSYWYCRECRDRGDRFYMTDHRCRGYKPEAS